MTIHDMIKHVTDRCHNIIPNNFRIGDTAYSLDIDAGRVSFKGDLITVPVKLVRPLPYTSPTLKVVFRRCNLAFVHIIQDSRDWLSAQ